MSIKLEVDLTDTLMAWMGEFHVQSGERHSTYYLSVPDTWAVFSSAELKSMVMAIFRGIYQEFNSQFRVAQPDDLGYLAPLDVNPRILTPEEIKAAPWLRAQSPAAWEWTSCIVVDDQGNYTKVEPSTF